MKIAIAIIFIFLVCCAINALQDLITHYSRRQNKK